MSQTPARAETPDAHAAPEPRPGMTYARARLWLGISGVGTFVTASAALLALDAPARAAAAFQGLPAADLALLAAFVAVYAAAQVPFDVLGGYALPKRHGRRHPAGSAFTAGLARGVAVHAAVLLACGSALLLAGRVGGLAGSLAAGAALPLMLLAARDAVARAAAPLRERPDLTPPATTPPSVFIAAPDEGFTGGLSGLARPRRSLIPAAWRDALDLEALDAAAKRREIAAATGAWLRGRAAAIAFTSTGIAVAALLVGAERLGTAAGTVELSLWFTLWSFAGLLTLPTVSRHAAAEIDRRLADDDKDPPRVTADAAARAAAGVNALQDGETRRPALVEAIFHPVPSVDARDPARRPARLPACWDTARTAIYLSAAGLGLLGRAVHCNAGRPALWVYLPTD